MMLIYNITLKIEWTIQSQWLVWMKGKYIPQVMETGCFTGYQLVRLLDIDEDEGPTYALQFCIENREKYVEYISHYQPQQDVLAYEKWSSSMLSFATLMEIVS